MELIDTMDDPHSGLRAELYEMAASGFTVFIFPRLRARDRESFVFDTEDDARKFARRAIVMGL